MDSDAPSRTARGLADSGLRLNLMNSDAKEKRMRDSVRMIIGMSVFAAALITSSWMLKGSPIGDWVDAGLYLATGCFFASGLQQSCSTLALCRRSGDSLV